MKVSKTELSKIVEEEFGIIDVVRAIEKLTSIMKTTQIDTSLLDTINKSAELTQQLIKDSSNTSSLEEKVDIMNSNIQELISTIKSRPTNFEFDVQRNFGKITKVSVKGY